MKEVAMLAVHYPFPHHSAASDTTVLWLILVAFAVALVAYGLGWACGRARRPPDSSGCPFAKPTAISNPFLKQR